MTRPPDPEVTAWLDRFAALVRSRDVLGGRAMFAPDCVSFGTRAERTGDLDALVEQQWAPIWTTTTGFAFTEAEVIDAEGAAPIVVLARWASTGEGPEGPFPRTGRATIVLVDDGLGGHVAVHTHFSSTPTTR